MVLVRGCAGGHLTFYFRVAVAHDAAARAEAVRSEIPQVFGIARVRRQEGAAAFLGALALLGRRVPHAYDRRQKRRHCVRRGTCIEVLSMKFRSNTISRPTVWCLPYAN